MYIQLRLMHGNHIARLQDDRTRGWHVREPRWEHEPNSLPEAIEQQHFANFQLWHEEDKARKPQAADHEIAAVKRTIDKINQRRNDLMERCDVLALQELSAQNLPRPDAPLHSESLGLIVDRLSILSLKIYHTREEVERENAPEGHAERNQQRLAVLLEQREDLAKAFDALWADVLAGKRQFKLYRQLKMYNEPSLNPAIYEANQKR